MPNLRDSPETSGKPPGYLSVHRLLDLLAIVVCLAAFAGACWVSIAIFDRFPYVEDEVVFLFQAKTIASGYLLAPAPPKSEFLYIPFTIINNGNWFGKYPPGYPAVLALGALVGQPWLINPLFGALSVGLVYLAGRRFYDRKTGLLAAALLTVSPFFLLQGGSFLSHTTSLFWALLFLLFFESARRRNSDLSGLLAGVALGMLFLTRPLTAVGIVVPFVVWAGIDVVRRRDRLLAYLPVVFGFAPFLAGFMAYNELTTGDPLVSAYEVYWPFDKIGFGQGIGAFGGHTIDDALSNTKANLDSLADYLFGWPFRLSLVPAGFAALLLAVRAAVGMISSRFPARLPLIRLRSPDAWGLVLLAVPASLMAAQMVYWCEGQMYGPRYYFEAIGALALISARGILGFSGVISGLPSRLKRLNPPRLWGSVVVLVAVAGLVLQSFFNFALPEFARFRGWYGIDRSGIDKVRAAGLRNAVVFVANEQWTDYAPFFLENAPSLDSSVVYAIDFGDEYNKEFMTLYPGRSFYSYANGRLSPP